ncbi:lipid droplet assembly factor 1-like [Phyllopteryx taeniolatus]|uniref:lipid droplet assembly factor 1-like n=1 Tax=Phyllopteryx taeniolatus TaxID=161469 RepID=UPI002AD29986|nr:lipid droplet assembly factor 1-like [Phyllopteryx taeniolatus]
MQPSSSSEMWEGWSAVTNQVCNDPKVTLLMNSRAVRYLNRHPLLALAAMFFCATAAVPVALFLLFAVATLVMSAVGFVILEGFLLSAAAVSLLCALSGAAFFSVAASAVFAAFYAAVSNILNYCYKHQTKAAKEYEKDDDDEEEMTPDNTMQ